VHNLGSRTAENLGSEEFVGWLSAGPYQNVILPSSWGPVDETLQIQSNSDLDIRPDTGFTGHLKPVSSVFAEIL